MNGNFLSRRVYFLFSLQYFYLIIAGDNESRKRFNDFYSTSTEEQSAKKRKCQESKIDSASQFNSVLKNLLMTGHDANAGYMCINTRKKISPDKSTIFNT